MATAMMLAGAPADAQNRSYDGSGFGSRYDGRSDQSRRYRDSFSNDGFSDDRYNRGDRYDGRDRRRGPAAIYLYPDGTYRTAPQRRFDNDRRARTYLPGQNPDRIHPSSPKYRR